MQNTGYIYVLGDGDNIRERIEFYLLNHYTEKLQEFSDSLIVAINKIKDVAISAMDAQIIIAGGDDILFSLPLEKYQKALIQELREIFFEGTGATISFGVGKTLEAAYINLRKAKSSKKDKIIEEEE